MFNGIIFNKGKITNIIKRAKGINIFIKSKLKLTNKQLGISISCDGVCLTLISYKKGISEFYLSNETLNVSKLFCTSETFDFFLIICLTLNPFLTASSEILYPVFPDAPVIAIFIIRNLFINYIKYLGFFTYKFLFSFGIKRST